MHLTGGDGLTLTLTWIAVRRISVTGSWLSWICLIWICLALGTMSRMRWGGRVWHVMQIMGAWNRRCPGLNSMGRQGLGSLRGMRGQRFRCWRRCGTLEFLLRRMGRRGWRHMRWSGVRRRVRRRRGVRRLGSGRMLRRLCFLFLRLGLGLRHFEGARHGLGQ
jgi:hypothetical protein